MPTIIDKLEISAGLNVEGIEAGRKQLVEELASVSDDVSSLQSRSISRLSRDFSQLFGGLSAMLRRVLGPVGDFISDLFQQISMVYRLTKDVSQTIYNAPVSSQQLLVKTKPSTGQVVAESISSGIGTYYGAGAISSEIVGFNKLENVYNKSIGVFENISRAIISKDKGALEKSLKAYEELKKSDEYKILILAAKKYPDLTDILTNQFEFSQDEFDKAVNAIKEAQKELAVESSRVGESVSGLTKRTAKFALLATAIISSIGLVFSAIGRFISLFREVSEASKNLGTTRSQVLSLYNAMEKIGAGSFALKEFLSRLAQQRERLLSGDLESYISQQLFKSRALSNEKLDMLSLTRERAREIVAEQDPVRQLAMILQAGFKDVQEFNEYAARMRLLPVEETRANTFQYMATPAIVSPSSAEVVLETFKKIPIPDLETQQKAYGLIHSLRQEIRKKEQASTIEEIKDSIEYFSKLRDSTIQGSIAWADYQEIIDKLKKQLDDLNRKIEEYQDSHPQTLAQLDESIAKYEKLREAVSKTSEEYLRYSDMLERLTSIRERHDEAIKTVNENNRRIEQERKNFFDERTAFGLRELAGLNPMLYRSPMAWKNIFLARQVMDLERNARIARLHGLDAMASQAIARADLLRQQISALTGVEKNPAEKLNQTIQSLVDANERALRVALSMK